MAFSAQQPREPINVTDLTGDGDLFDSSIYTARQLLELQEMMEVQRREQEEARAQRKVEEVRRREYEQACAVRLYDQGGRKRYFSHSIFETPSSTITSSTLSRTHPDHTKPFGFLHRIPAELRNTIYEYLLESRGPLHVNDYKDRPTLSIACVSHPNFPFSHLARGDEPQVDRLAIARVSKQVSREVMPIAYRKNEFAFDSADTLAQFLDMIGKNARHLRKIIVPGAIAWGLDMPAPRFENLALATNLTSLKINHEGIYLHALSGYAKISVSDLLVQLTSFLRARHEASVEKRAAGDVLQVVELAEFEVCDNCDRLLEHCKRWESCKHAFATKRGKAHLENVSAKLKKAIAMELDIELGG